MLLATQQCLSTQGLHVQIPAEGGGGGREEWVVASERKRAGRGRAQLSNHPARRPHRTKSKAGEQERRPESSLLILFISPPSSPLAPYIEHAEQHLDKNLASRVNLQAPES